MPQDRNSLLPADEVAAAAAVRRLGEALLSRTVSPLMTARVAEQLEALAVEVETFPPRTKVEAFHAYPGHQRVEHFIETGRWPDPPGDGDELVFDALSFVGGRLSPLSAGVRYFRDGDEAVAKVNFGRCYEGPPSRVHGGMLAAAFDEVMGAAFRVTGTASAFTGELTVRYSGPAPIEADLVFRARIDETRGRKHLVSAEAVGPDGEFAQAKGTFIEMEREQLTKLVESL